LSAEKIRLLGEYLRLTSESRVLDIACGKGGPALILAATYGCRVHGVEIRPAFAEAARARAAALGLESLIQVQTADASGLQFEPETWDAALCLGASFVWGTIADAAAALLPLVAGNGRALELGIGTGRIAVPLAQRGVPVHGIELSKAMAARLRAKPGGEDIGVTIGDFATTRVEGTFSVAYLVFNTIMNLTTQAAQVACFRNVAALLDVGGCFVIEVGVPGLQRLPPGETIHAFHVSETRWGIDEYDVARQGLTSHHFEIVDGRLERFAVPFRYAWPAELDLMAQLAGMRLRERWTGWNREPFTSNSRKHVSVWEKPAI